MTAVLNFATIGVAVTHVKHGDFTYENEDTGDTETCQEMRQITEPLKTFKPLAIRFYSVTFLLRFFKRLMKSTSKISARTALSNTLEFDSGELVSYQYQPGRFPRAIYGVDPSWYCVGKTPPKASSMDHLAGLKWKKHPDQFWAEQANTVIWVADMNSEEEGDE